VKAYLVKAGIKTERLTTTGFGATKPVSTNDTSLGRSQNRRVEVVKS
jgi:OOP family OmpA-OmpF porin